MSAVGYWHHELVGGKTVGVQQPKAYVATTHAYLSAVAGEPTYGEGTTGHCKTTLFPSLDRKSLVCRYCKFLVV